MFRFNIILLVLCYAAECFAQQPIWGRVISSKKGDVCMEVKSTPKGEIFLFGFFGDSLEVGDQILVPEPGQSSFIVKYDTAGRVAWTYVLKGSEVLIENAAIDSQGNIIFEGRFWDKLMFNNQVYQNESTTQGVTAFVGKIGVSGEPLWLNIFQHSSYGNLDIDDIGNIYFIHGTYADAPEPTSAWIHKYETNGNLIWEKRISSSVYPSTAFLSTLTITNGQPIVAGTFNGDVTLSGSQFSGPDEPDGSGFFITKLDIDGSTKWVKNIGNSSYNNRSVSDIMTVDDGGFYLSGGLPNQTLLAKYDALGNMIWSKRTQGDSFSNSVLCDSQDGAIYLAADFYKSPKLDDYQLKGTDDSPTIENAPNIAIMKLTRAGEILWLTQFEPGVSSFNDVSSLTRFQGDIYLSGFTDSPILKIGPLELTVKNSDPLNSGDGFLVKIGDRSGDGLLVIPILELGTDTTLCENQTFILSPSGFVSYKWQDNSTESTYVVDNPGLYSVTVIDQYGNESRDTIRVSDCQSNELFIPNVITCNGDSYNEFFKIQGIDLNLLNSLTIFNRWGKVVLHEASYQNNWNAASIDSGIYYFQFYYEGTKKSYRGSLHVIK
jgi:gliding motility-associated-like protein